MTEGTVPRKGFVWNQFPAILWAAIILLGTSIPAKEIPDLSIFRFDKIIHASIYLVLCLLTYRALQSQKRFPLLSRWSLLLSLLMVMAYGALDEIHQLLVPGRTADFWDFAADAVGACVSIAVVSFLHRSTAARRASGEREAPSG